MPQTLLNYASHPPPSIRPLALALAMLAASQVQAQGLEEVVVTAQKREQSLQEAPIAISAFDQGELQQRGIRTLVDLGSIAPNVKVAPLDRTSGGEGKRGARGRWRG